MHQPDDLPPPHSGLTDLDAALRAIHPEPRSSLGPEIAGRAARGERPRRLSRLRAVRLGSVAAVLLLLVIGLARGGYAPALDAFAATSTVDRCCADLDGEGKPDDGVLVESVARHRVRHLMVYEENDSDRAWTPGEVIRFFRDGRPALNATPGADSLVTREFCCSDYDGGGDADDGVLVVASPAGDVLLAALFDRSDSSASNPLR
jgi:hypothetical protein